MTAIYRTYRPKLFKDLLGHEHIVTILQNAIREDRLSHAYLFHGSRGTGKTTTARLLAKLANCHKIIEDVKNKNKGEPCDQCLACQSINNGQALDVIEIDAASNRGIDEIRDLQEKARLSPSSLKYKIFIIDEVHMLTSAAFNALLKTLEEPPKHVIFILATTEIEKVPITITSRTQKLTFKKLTKDIIMQKLKTIALKENIDIDNESLEIISQLAEGSLRDAESIFDQVTTNNGQKITIKDIEKTLGISVNNNITILLQKLFENNLDEVLNIINTIVDNGYDIIHFNKNLIDYLSKVIALKSNPKAINIFKLNLTENELKKLEELANLSDLNRSIELIKSLIEAHRNMRYSPFSYIPLQVTLIEYLNKKANFI